MKKEEYENLEKMITSPDRESNYLALTIINTFDLKRKLIPTLRLLNAGCMTRESNTYELLKEEVANKGPSNIGNCLVELGILPLTLLIANNNNSFLFFLYAIRSRVKRLGYHYKYSEFLTKKQLNEFRTR